MAKKKKCKDKIDIGIPKIKELKRWPFIIHYSFMGEKDSMEVFHYSPLLAKQTFKCRYPQYKLLKLEPSEHQRDTTIPPAETDDDDFILNLTLLDIIQNKTP